MSKVKDEAIREFKTSSEFTELLGKNYVAGFKDIYLDATDAFPGVDFNSIKLLIAAKSSLLQSSSEDVNIEDDAFIPLPTKDDSKSGDVVTNGLSK